MKIVFMGTPDFAVPSLEVLAKSSHTVTGVFCQPDKPVGRKQIITPPAVKVCAQAHGLPVYQPQTLRNDTAVQLIKDLNPDLIVVAAYGKILPPQILSVPRYGCLNLHGSLLPKYRGAAPIQRAVMNGDAQTGITMMKMDEGMDTGDILRVISTPIGAEETAGEVFDRLSVLGAEHLLETITLLEQGKLIPQKQDKSQATYAPMLQKEEGHLDWNFDAQTVFDRIRGLNPWPVAYALLGEKKLKIFKARKADDIPGKPGQLSVKNNRLLVCCGSGTALSLEEIQPEGSKRMSAAQFLCGNHIEDGTFLR